MSGSFTGFSEDDIRKLNNRNPEELIKSNVIGNQERPVLKAQKRSNKTKQQTNKILNETIQNAQIEPIAESAKLNKTDNLKQQIFPDNLNCDKSTENIQKNVPSLDTIEVGNSSKIPEGESNIRNENQMEMPERKLDLEEFQAKQKLIEEQNRKRKEILIKALAVKTKQTQEETQRLNEIREEFKKLDDLLSSDVKILRKQIEVASLDYMEAQKRYFRVEKEFLDAKLVLHQKLERKELLTEHLCAIIEKNEERKAAKLNELLLKLNLRPDLQNTDNLEQAGDNTKIEKIDNDSQIITDNAKNIQHDILEKK